jgi:hypothetical protein
MKGKVLKLVLLISLVFNFSIIFAAGYFYYRDSICSVPIERRKDRRSTLKTRPSAEQRKR